MTVGVHSTIWTLSDCSSLGSAEISLVAVKPPKTSVRAPLPGWVVRQGGGSVGLIQLARLAGGGCGALQRCVFCDEV